VVARIGLPASIARPPKVRAPRILVHASGMGSGALFAPFPKPA
jgi:hypothetical protein